MGVLYVVVLVVDVVDVVVFFVAVTIVVGLECYPVPALS